MPYIPSAHDITSLYPVGIHVGTIDTHRTLKMKEKTRLHVSLSKQTHKATLCVKFSNVNRMSQGRGVWSNPHSSCHLTLDDELV